MSSNARKTTSRKNNKKLSQFEKSNIKLSKKTEKDKNTSNVKKNDSNENNIKIKPKQTEHKFWDKKPVTRSEKIIPASEQIFSDLKEVPTYNKQEPLRLPTGMSWGEGFEGDEEYVKDVSDFLSLHHSVGLSNSFKVNYTPEYVKWVLGKEPYMITIRSDKNNAICGTICGSIESMTVFDKTELFVVVKFICAHPLYHKKNIAQILIDEMTRRGVLAGYQMGSFVTDRCVPTPVTTMRCYRRPINYTNLYESGFTNMGKKFEEDKQQFEISDDQPSNYKKIMTEDLEDVHNLYCKYMTKFNIHTSYTKNQIGDLLLNIPFVESYTIRDENDKIIDFVSYYKVNYTYKENIINTSNLFLHSCNDTDLLNTFEDLFKIMKQDNVDIFNVMDIMEVGSVILSKIYEDGNLSDDEDHGKMYETKFLRGNIKLYLNFFNWQCPDISSKQLSWYVY
jgi:glycylpeptide N-tetradecanoyltransferase